MSIKDTNECKQYYTALNYLLKNPEKRTEKNLSILGDKFDSLCNICSDESVLRIKDFNMAHVQPKIDTPEKVAKFFSGRVCGELEYLPCKQ